MNSIYTWFPKRLIDLSNHFNEIIFTRQWKNNSLIFIIILFAFPVDADEKYFFGIGIWFALRFRVI